jgi:hypothetical protein
MSLFTPVQGLIGGSLIGAAAGTLLLFNGDIMGFSGLLSTAILHPKQTFKENPWKLTFLASFSCASTLYLKYIDPNCLELPTGFQGPSKLAFALSGLMVGFGTKLGNGCTSGHGICGLARFSKRSFANVCCFMTTGILTTVCMSLLDKNVFRSSESLPVNSNYGLLFTAVTLMAALPNLANKKTLGAMMSASMGAIGLAASGMVKASKIQSFLDISALWKDPSQYDPTLMCVMGSGVVASLVSYQFHPNHTLQSDKSKCMTKPIKGDEFHVPTNTTIDWKLLLGGVVFGVGWAIGCFCPGPALFNIAVGSEGAILYWFPCYLGGAYLAQTVVAYSNKSKDKTN